MPQKKLTSRFKSWFDDSKVVDTAGDPLVVYHGTDAEFDIFHVSRSQNGGQDEIGAFFTTNKEAAEDYGERVISAYLCIKKPYNVPEKQWYAAEGMSPT